MISGGLHLSLCPLSMRDDDDGILQFRGQDSVSVAQTEDGGSVLERGLGEEPLLGRVFSSHHVILIRRIFKLRCAVDGRQRGWEREIGKDKL